MGRKLIKLKNNFNAIAENCEIRFSQPPEQEVCLCDVDEVELKEIKENLNDISIDVDETGKLKGLKRGNKFIDKKKAQLLSTPTVAPSKTPNHNKNI